MKKITIGRNADNDIVIADQSVSGYHADIEIHDNGVMLFIDHSTNGTVVNGNHLHQDYCRVSGIDEIVFPGHHSLDWTLIPIPEAVQEEPATPALQSQAAPYQPVQEAGIGFVEVLTKFWNNYFNFSGRARRKEYWLMVVWNIIFGCIPVVGWLVMVASCIGALSLLVRRLHDSGKSGWFVLLSLIPVVGSIILLVFCCQDSDKCQNKWGPSPKYVKC